MATATATPRTPRTRTRRCCNSSRSSRGSCCMGVVVHKYGSVIILLTLYFGVQVLKKHNSSLQLENLLLLAVGDKQRHRGGIDIRSPFITEDSDDATIRKDDDGEGDEFDSSILSDNTTTTTTTTPAAASGAEVAAVGRIYWCGNSPNSKALRYMFPEYHHEFDSSSGGQWSPNTKTTLQEEEQQQQQEEDDTGGNNRDGDDNSTTINNNILIMSMYQSLEECDTRQALARFLIGNPQNNNTNSNSNNNNNNKILFVNGESVGNVFDWSAIENGYVYVEQEEDDQEKQQQQEEDEDNGVNATAGRQSPKQKKKKRTTKVVISDDVSQHVYQIGPVAGRSGLKDDSTITTTITSATTTTSSTKTSTSSDLSTSYNSLTLRNSQQVFLFTIDLLSRMVHELEAELELEMEQEMKGQQDRPSQQFENQLQNTKTWKALTSPSDRPRNTGLHNAAAYFHNNCRPHRQKAAQLISSVLPVHFGSEGCTIEQNPRFPNNTIRNIEIDGVEEDDDGSSGAKNITSRRPRRSRRRNRKRDLRDRWGSLNSELFSKYKYCLVMENRLGIDGYMTEKLLNALLGGCLPIYAGLSRHQFYDIFNPHAVIYWDTKKPHRSLNLLKELESNSTKYDEMLRAPILQPHAVNKYFSITPSLGDDGSLNHRIRQMMGLPPYRTGRRPVDR